MNYCLLINNKHYLTYNVNAEKIILAEFNILNEKYNFAKNVQIKDICGLKYLSYENINNNIDILDKISELSFVLGIFEKKNELLKPIAKTNIEFVNNNISSLLKYSGKTNEYFTKLMINIAANLIDKNENINLLDPICGKGTSLYEGLIKGYNCYGIEIASKVVEEIFIFLKKFLEKERYKFNSKKEKFSGENKSFKAEKFIFEINKNKENLYQTQLKQIVKGAEDYYATHLSELPKNESDEKTITLKQLQDSGNLSLDIKNPKTNDNFSPNTKIIITKVGKNYKYTIDERTI